MGNNPGYFSEIVYLRAIAILAVISVRVANDFNLMNSINFLTLLYMSITTFSGFGVPLFVCISGFVLFNKYQGSFSLKSFYKKRLLSVVPQYTIFSIFAVIFWYVVYTFTGRVWIFSFTDFIKGYLEGTTYTHLWFIVLIIQLYILYPFIEKIFTKSVENQKAEVLLVFFLFVQILYWIYFIDNVKFVGETFFLAYVFYFVLGMYVRYSYSNYKNMGITSEYGLILFFALISGTILGIGQWSIEYFHNDLTQLSIYIYDVIFEIVKPLYYVLIFVLCLCCALKISEMHLGRITRATQIIGNYSFGIYLMHAFIAFSVSAFLFSKFGIDLNNWLYYPIVFTLVLGLSLGFVYLISKVPYHEYIIGSVK